MQKKARLEKVSTKMSDNRSNETLDDKNARLEKVATKMSDNQSNETLDDKKDTKDKNKANMTDYRDNETQNKKLQSWQTPINMFKVTLARNKVLNMEKWKAKYILYTWGVRLHNAINAKL